MTVKLWYAPLGDIYPGGFCSVHTNEETAMSQAIADSQADKVPAPDRIVDEDGSILADGAQIRAAASTE